ncbi:MAG: lipopolysaccharide transport periplasmic protein LptA [Geopsychrobacter sp.]|nr:lipopolysaccharide transport periplasmic protein LptA [Geopsychrobacter sp.]
MRFCGLLLLVLMMLTPVLAAEKETSAPSGPIEVTSDRMDADRQKGEVLFSGHVVAKRGTMTIYAARLTLYLVKEGTEQAIDRLVAEEDVRLVDGERIATAKRLDYDQKTEKMLLTGNAEVHQGGNLVMGEEIELFLKEDRSVVKGGEGGRVRAVFKPAKENP